MEQFLHSKKYFLLSLPTFQPMFLLVKKNLTLKELLQGNDLNNIPAHQLFVP